MAVYLLQSGAKPVAAALVGIATGTNIKTLLQVKLGPSTNMKAKVVEWGVSFDGSAPATPGKAELLATGQTATITEFVVADISCYDPLIPAVTDDFPFALTAAGEESGYNATAEGTITTSRLLDGSLLIAPTNSFTKQFMLGYQPEFKSDEFLRIRVHFGTSVNAFAYVVIEI